MTDYRASIIYISLPLVLFDATCPAHIAYNFARRKITPS